MVYTDKNARNDEKRVGELDDGETAEVACVDEVRYRAEKRQGEGEAVEQPEENLHDDDAIYKSRQYSARDHGVFFDYF